MRSEGSSTPSGDLFMKVIRGSRSFPELEYPEDPTVLQIAQHALPSARLPEAVNDWRRANMRRIFAQTGRLVAARAAQKIHGMPFMYGALWLRVFRGDGTVEDLGLASLRVVTNAGVAFLAADMAGGASDINLFKFHGYGTGTTAEATSDTALVTELTTQYNPDNTRPTGSQSSSTNTYTTVGTLTPDSGGTIAIAEHGIFSATSAGTLWDRSQFAAVNINSANGDSLQTTYVATFPSGG